MTFLAAPSKNIMQIHQYKSFTMWFPYSLIPGLSSSRF